MSVSRRDDGDIRRSDQGFTMVEMMITVLVLMIVSGTVMKGVLDLTGLHNVIMNRTDMHSGVRNATELLTQEVGQAGRIALPAAVTMTAATVIGSVDINGTATTRMVFWGQLALGSRPNQDTATV